MIKLNFEILSFYYETNDFRKKHIDYHISKMYDENISFGEVLLSIYNMYKIDNDNFKNYFIPHLTELLWKKYFTKEFCHNIDILESSYLNLSIADLEKQFCISNLVILVYLNYDGIGKTIGNKHGIKLYFHLDEKNIHHRPHIHCQYSGCETRIEIEILKVLDKPFKKSKMDIAKRFIKENQKDLIKYWNKAVINGQPIDLNLKL